MRRVLLVSLAVIIAVPAVAWAQPWSTVAQPPGPNEEQPMLLDIAMDGGTVWFSTQRDGIRGYDGATWVLHTQAEGGLRHDKWRYVMYVDSSGDKWTAKDSWQCIDRLDDGGTFSVKTDDTWTYYSNPSELQSKRVFSLAEDHAGNMWCGMQDENSTEPTVVELLIENGPGTEDDEWVAFGDTYEPDPGFFWRQDVRELAIDAHNRLWLRYNNAGVDVWDFGDYESFEDDTMLHYGAIHGLPSDAVRTLCAVADGRVWAGTDRGVAYIDPGDESWTTVEDFPSDQVNDLAADAQGHVWAATDDGVVMIYKSGVVDRLYSTADGLADEEATLVAVDQSTGRVWAVTREAATGNTRLNTFDSGFGAKHRVMVYPNPWRQGESVDGDIRIVGVPAGSAVEVIDLTGQVVRELSARSEPFLWDSLDTDLNEVPSGVYIIRVDTPSGEQLFTKIAIIR
jgi:hypothetical protein